MPPAIQVPTYDQAYAQLGAAYDPQTAQVNSEIGQLPGQQQAQQSALDQAKVNAFRDITTQANSRGMLFSGQGLENDARYVGTKYLPAVANLNTAFQNSKNTLLEKINQLNSARVTQAQGIVSSAATAANDNYYKNAQLQLGYARLGQSASNAANKPLTTTQLTGAIRQGLENVKGGDGHVSPSDLAGAYKDWTHAGLEPSKFWTNFRGYWNPNQANYNQAFYGVVNKR